MYSKLKHTLNAPSDLYVPYPLCTPPSSCYHHYSLLAYSPLFLFVNTGKYSFPPLSPPKSGILCMLFCTLLFFFFSHLKKDRASRVAQWLIICLPMQGTRVRALVWEDPTCHGATRPVSHNY